jgi:hypothetical protein
MPKCTFNLTPDIVEWLDSIADPYAGKSVVVRDLLRQAKRQYMQAQSQGVDRPDTLGGPPAGGTPSSSTLSSTSNFLDLNPKPYKAVTEGVTGQLVPITPDPEQLEPEPAKRSRKRKPKAEGCPEFEQWWKQYLSISKRASNQSKPKALEEWTAACKAHTPDQLLAALKSAVQTQARIERDGGFATPFPDAFRWLRDGYHVSHVPGALQGQPAASQRAPWDSPERLPGDPF